MDKITDVYFLNSNNMKTLIIDDKPVRNYNDNFEKDGWNFAPLYVGNFLKPKINWETLQYYESATDEEIQNEANKKNEEIEMQLYLKRIEDAKQIWARLSARFRIKKQQGVLDDATENIILAELKPVLDIVVPFGQWITGQNLLIQIGDSVIGSELYNELFQIFDNYIQQNYSPIEIENSKISQENK